MGLIRQRTIRFTFDPKHTLLSFKTGFQICQAEMTSAILESTSDFEPSSETFETCDRFELLSFYHNLLLDIIGAVCHQFGLCSTNLYFKHAGFV